VIGETRRPVITGPVITGPEITGHRPSLCTVPAQTRGQRLRRMSRAVIMNHDPAPLRRQCFAKRRSDPPGTAGHQRCFAFKLHPKKHPNL